ncbi:ABC-three component system protein [Ahrensia sp. 13_GOM-1096m]|uniref:ABC-three component system protein n=1 Tax=Ahrensia sp. 13_GOM-1096m TaxID=1380380 RepID=UPI00047EC1CA|nr:ABC-three component system protein [Ahrensia sp. 13_GOM-1096m]
MNVGLVNSVHDATASALGFRYQERFALLELLREKDEEAAVAIEALDDVQLTANGTDILEQLKHSFAKQPAPIDIKSTNLWTTLRIWADLLSSVDISSTRFALITVAPLSQGSLLECLQTIGSDRSALQSALVSEAQRVLEEVSAAELAGKKRPHAKRLPGVNAYLSLPDKEREELLSKIVLRPDAPKIDALEETFAKSLDTYPVRQRETLARKIYEWWDRQVLLSFEGKRNRFIARHEILEQLSETCAMLHTETLMDSFSSKQPPLIFHTNEMLAKQCDLVDAKSAMLRRARISEWQARNQRSQWSIEAPSKHSKIVDYDEKLVLEWEYQHDTACENVIAGDETSQKSQGLNVLKWALEDAAAEVGSIESTITSPFYVRGSYQVLSIQGRVGWHPEYIERLGFKK